MGVPKNQILDFALNNKKTKPLLNLRMKSIMAKTRSVIKIEHTP